MNSKVTIVILAAGSSSRMGKIKQLLPWKDSTLLEHTIKIAKSSKANQLIVILGSNARLIKETIKIKTNNVIFLENTEWKSGMGTSISCGVNYLLDHNNDTDAVLILLADQALIDTEYLDEIIGIYSNSKIELIGSRYGDKIGVPALFKRTYFTDLQKLDGDNGAQLILNKCGDKVHVLNPLEKIYDVDTLEDYNNLLKMSND
ncbi:nucleotidyltransferase family protein [uncultured Eudoraea sp.]|uniref:nucleotidyltransferase family protein n=1 Tax=uncultured Eudoraea sp. TaxID=1035614 RepID=UPI00260B31C3|nr:nucleotidyltransferase family protein [uncultured Eudoraea sp.]